jgi:hypothetical protein
MKKIFWIMGLTIIYLVSYSHIAGNLIYPYISGGWVAPIPEPLKTGLLVGFLPPIIVLLYLFHNKRLFLEP